MNRIIWHHTGGSHTPNATDLRAYHFVIAGDGRVHRGAYPVSANAGQLRRGAYAAHTRGLNTGSIGVALACMAGSDWADPFTARWFPTQAQMDSLISLTADLCEEYGIPVNPRHVLSHAEVEPTLGVAQRNKWDFDYDPRGVSKSRNPVSIGDRLRKEVLAALGGKSPKPAPIVRSTLRRGTRGKEVAHLQRLLGVADDGVFGPATDAAVREFQEQNDLLPDGIVGRMTWAALE
jgi:peptidoglycan hydrolase-like protein with peptidoglycan-binding domain